MSLSAILKNRKEEGVEDISLLRPYFYERFIAKFIDFLIMAGLASVPSVIGPLAGMTYILISDGLMGGQSIGKKIIGYRAVSADDRDAPCDFRMSIIRNSPFALLAGWYYLIKWIPYLGPLLAVIAWLAFLFLEVVLIYTDEESARFGDRIARTRVVGVAARVKSAAG